MEPASYGIDVLHSEVAVLEVEQQPDADSDGDAAEHLLQARFLCLVHPAHQIEVGDDRHDEVDDELRRAPGIEHQRGE